MCLSHLTDIAPSEAHYRDLINVVTHLDKSVQVLLAVASGLPEAYVIFETLNDRGADLTTADLLKNYLFSQSRSYLDHVEQQWSTIARTFDKPEDLVKFIRHEHSSREGKVTTRKLYKVLQSSIGRGQKRVRDYAGRLEDSLQPFTALREPDSEFWGRTDVDVRDSLLAFRRFGFESSMPLLLAILNSWEITPAAKMVNKIMRLVCSGMVRWAARRRSRGGGVQWRRRCGFLWEVEDSGSCFHISGQANPHRSGVPSGSHFIRRREHGAS